MYFSSGKIEKMITYRPEFYCLETMLNCNQFYTIIFANYYPSMLGNYKITFESDAELQIKPIPDEGYDLSATKIKVFF